MTTLVPEMYAAAGETRVVGLRDVADRRNRPGTEGGDALDGAGDLLLAATVDPDRRSLLRQPTGDLRADPTAGAGHKRHLAIQRAAHPATLPASSRSGGSYASPKVGKA